jgi:hypothetical protein
MNEQMGVGKNGYGKENMESKSPSSPQTAGNEQMHIFERNHLLFYAEQCVKADIHHQQQQQTMN